MSAFGKNDFELAYVAACTALEITTSICRELAELTRSVAELVEAVKAMRDAEPNQRVFAALDLLRARRTDERKAAEASDPH
jgi:hypothetical protein